MVPSIKKDTNRPPRRPLGPMANVALVLIGAVPFVVLVVVADLLKDRSEADLQIADACVDWSHDTPELKAGRDPGFIAQCQRYFRLRTPKDAAQDDQRWEQRRQN